MGGVAFYERQEVKDVLAYLNLMTNPKDDMAFGRVVNVPPRGIGKTSVEHLCEAARQRGCWLRWIISVTAPLAATSRNTRYRETSP